MMRHAVTAEWFLSEFTVMLKAMGSWDAYTNNDAWTEVAKAAARMACESAGLIVSREYFRLDVMGYQQRVPGRSDGAPI